MGVRIRKNVRSLTIPRKIKSIENLTQPEKVVAPLPIRRRRVGGGTEYPILMANLLAVFY
jgi:hypothetical protein